MLVWKDGYGVLEVGAILLTISLLNSKLMQVIDGGFS